jgi:O-antigen/teichoic acid export membrane protein
LGLNSAAPEGEVAGRILANALHRSIADVGSKVASVVLYIVMARRLGDADFGVFTFGLAFVTLVTTLGGFGQDSVLTREVARDRGRLPGYFANTVALKLVLALPALAVAILGLWIFGANDETLFVAVLLGLGVVAELLMNTCFATFQAYERLAYVPVILIFQRFATAGVGIAALLLGAGVVAVSGVYLWGALLAVLLAFGIQFRYVAAPQFDLDVGRWWPLMRAAFPIGIFMVFALVLFRVDTAILAVFKPADVVGNYGVAYRLLETTLFLSWGVGAAVYPVLSRLSPTSEPPLALIYSRALKLVVALTLPLAAGAALLGQPLVRLIYGSDFDEAGNALVLLAPTIALYPVAYISGNLLLSQDRQRALTKVYGVIAAQNILANLVLIPWLSLYGAALETSISQLLLTVWLLWYAIRAVGTLHPTRIVAGPALATSAAAAAMLLLGSELGPAIIVGAAAYVVVLTAFEFEFFPEDARTVRQFVLRRSV